VAVQVQCRTCNREVAGSNESRPGLLRTKVYSAFHPSVNEYQLQLGRQRQVWLIARADETQVCTGKTVIFDNACYKPERLIEDCETLGILLLLAGLGR